MMKNNYLKILRLLTNSEIKEFGRYLPYAFPRSKAICQVHEYYASKRTNYPNWETALKEIFPEEDTKLFKLKNYLSDLFLELKRFLIQKKCLTEEFEQEFLWLQILEEKEMLHEKDLQLKKILKALKGEKAAAHNAYQEYQLQKFQYFNNQNVKKEKSAQTLLEADAALDEFYFSAKLGLASEMKSMKNVYGISVDSDFLHPVLLHLDARKESFSIFNQFYFLLYQFNSNQSEKTYDELQNFLFEYEQQLPSNEQIIAITTLINYTAGKIKEAGIGFIKKAFQLYQFGLKKDVFVYRGVMNSRNYENIINVACRVKEFEWAEAFSEAYEEKLPQTIRETSFRLGKAIIAFSQRKFDEMPDLLKNLESINILQNLRIRTLQLATDFELKANIYLNEKCEGFERFVRRHKQLGEQNTRAALNFSII